jgi:hypothetical protein
MPVSQQEDGPVARVTDNADQTPQFVGGEELNRVCPIMSHFIRKWPLLTELSNSQTAAVGFCSKSQR